MIWPKVRDVLLAASFLNGKVRRTPVEMSLDLSEVTGGNVYLKWENLQFCGSFKIRGALNKIFHMSEEERKRGGLLRLQAVITHKAWRLPQRCSMSRL